MKRIILLISFLMVGSQAFAAFNEDEPLPPEQVFKYKIYAINADTLRAEFNVLDGYYLYKDKFKFSTPTAGVALNAANYPKGKIKKDEFFGTVETFHHKFNIDIPLTRTDANLTRVDLDLQYQGCAEAGLCYPPQKQKASVNLPPPDNALRPVSATPAPQTSILDKLKKPIAANNDDAILDADQAFIFDAAALNGTMIVAHWTIADGYYLYKDNFSFVLKSGDGVQLGAPEFPKGKEKEDEFFGKREVFLHEVSIAIPVARSKTGFTEIELLAKYQGCADVGFCFPPIEKTTVVAMPAVMTTNTLSQADTTSSSAPFAVSEQDQFASMIKDASIWATILGFFVGGLLLSFTPCVFPMIPILSSIIVGQGQQISNRRSFAISVVYVLAMAITYTIAGVLAGLFGSNLQAEFQNPWVLGTFSVVFVLLAMSMFGFYDLQLPSSWQAKLTTVSNSQRGGTYTGVAIMGFLSALIVGPCVAAPLMGALIYIGQSGDAFRGGVALFAMSIGMGMPLLAIGASAGKLLPKAGAWMESVKAIFGVLLIAVAIWLIERVIPAAVALFLWAALLIISAVYMGALTHLESAVSGWRKLWKGVGIVFLMYGGLLLVGVATNGDDPLQPLRGVMASVNANGQTQSTRLEFKTIKTIDELNAELSAAKLANKPVMLDFYADWCVSCKEMERYTFSKPGVQAAMSQGVLLKADVTDNDDNAKALLRQFKLVGPPSMIFYDRSGVEKQGYRLVGFLEAEKFQSHVERAFQ